MGRRSSGDLIAGKYRLEKPLARGGMGELWTARNLQLDVPVAIKLMSAHALASADLIARFEREAKAAAQLRHANVVSVYEHGVFEEVPFMAMELLEGQDLSARLKERGRLPVAEAITIVTFVCKALQRAHAMGIVHRDLKPANVFLARQDDDEIVKVLDFGIAKLLRGVLGAESTKQGALLGTPYYMAPEQARNAGVKIDHRADLWALGVIAFRMLTGKLPFVGEPALAVLVRICTESAPRASSLAPDLDARTDAFFVRALCRDPAERFQSARELASAFAALDAPVEPAVAQARASLPSVSHAADSVTLFDPGMPLPPALATSPETRREDEDPSARPSHQGGRVSGPIGEARATGAEAGGAAPRGRGPGEQRPPLGSSPAPAETGTHAVFERSADPGTITNASSETGLSPSLGPKRNTVIVVGAILAAVLVIAVVGWTAFSAMSAPEERPGAAGIPLPLLTATVTHPPIETATALPGLSARPAESTAPAPAPRPPAAVAPEISANANKVSPTPVPPTGRVAPKTPVPVKPNPRHPSF